MSSQTLALRQRIEIEVQQPVFAAVTAVADEVRRRHGPTTAAILFYGSCLRSGTDEGGIIDLYTVVERYGDAHASGISAALNAVLPPNVYYLTIPLGTRTVRAKYATISLDDFVHGASPRAYQPLIWGRFSQPCVLIYVRDAEIEKKIVAALTEAASAMIIKAVPLMQGTFTSRKIWIRAFVESYRTELRAERLDYIEELYRADAARYDGVMVDLLAAGSLPDVRASSKVPGDIVADLSSGRRRRSRVVWWTRRWTGKPLSAARLAKAVFTFSGGVDYILWKIERHSGVGFSATPWQKRHPLLTACMLFWRLYRRQAFR